MTQNDTLNPSPSKYMALPVVVAVSLVVQALASMSAILPSAIAPELAAALGVPGSLIGFQVSCVYIGAMAASLVGGVFVRRFGALRCFQMALFFVAIGGAMSAIPLLLAVGVGGGIVGLGYGLTNPPSSHLLMKVTTPKNRNLVFSIKQTGVPLGGVVAGLIGPWVALQFGWQMVLASGAFVSLTLMIGISIFRPYWDTDRDAKAILRVNPLRDVGIVWEYKGLRWVSLSAFSFAAMQVGLSTFAVTMLVGDLNFSLIEAGVVLAVMQAAGVMGRVLWGWVADHSGNPSGVLAAITSITVICALTMVLLDAKTPIAFVYILLVTIGMTAIGWNGVFLAEIAHLAPTGLISSATGGAMVITYAGVMLGPAAMSSIYGYAGSYTLTFGLFAVIPLAGLFFVFRARKFSNTKRTD
jgi:predicted MFS family arabinose efflux permease